MSDILSQDAVLSATILKPCKKCGHPRGDHVEDKKCRVKGCNCQKFEE